MTALRATFAPTLLLSLLAACAAEPSREWLDDSAETEVDAPLGAADSAASTATYYLARPDLRRCVWPLCGGMWVHRANRTTTRCSDGRYASECYVAQLDASAIGLTADETSTLSGAFSGGQAIVEGSIGQSSTGSRTYAVLRAEHAWTAANDAAPDGVFYSLVDNGIRCFRAPCFSIDEAKLDSTLARTLSDVDAHLVGLTSEQESAIGPALAGEGLLASGHNARDRRTGAVSVVATQLYFPVLPAATSCTTDSDCTLTTFPTPVTSEAECYCPGCPSPALAGTAAANRASWDLYCAATHGIDVCPVRSCAPPPPAACNAEGTCTFGRPEL